MADLSGFPTAEVQFDRDANIIGSVDAVLRLAADPTITDLLVLCHGWNNDMGDARQLYRDLASSLRSVLDSGAAAGLANRKIAIAGVLWPSKKFADSDLIPGGAAAAASPVDAELILGQIEGLRAVFPDPAAQQTLDSVSALVPLLPDKASARASFADQLRSLLDPAAAEPEDGSTDLFAVSGRTLMDRLAIPVSLAPPTGTTGGAAARATATNSPGSGGAAGFGRIGSLLGGPFGAARNLLNFTTYYEMKNRAGVIGERGLAPILVGLHSTRSDLNIHLVGHSFGARLVSAATKALPANPPDTIATLSLLQAAFSHYGFADDWDARSPGQQQGYFRNVITEHKVTGPMLITHTGNDKAVGIAYAIASRVAGQVAAAVGDANDIYGGIGRNGAQKTNEAVPAELLDVGGNYTWRNRTMHNLLADKFISDHSAVTGKQVAYALLSALSAGARSDVTETPETGFQGRDMYGPETGFRGRDMYGSVVAVPLLELIRAAQSDAATSGRLLPVVIDLHLEHPEGREAARQAVLSLIHRAITRSDRNHATVEEESVNEERSGALAQYVVARLTPDSILEVARLDSADARSGKARAIYRIWPDFPIRPLINKSLATVKADAAHTAFTARGSGIVWAVVDSGIETGHPHFEIHKTLAVSLPVRHLDLTGGKSPLTDKFGHGTHVAGIIAGECIGTAGRPLTAVRIEREYNSDDDFIYRPEPVTAMAGMAPACRLVSYKVLNDGGGGETSAIIAALQDIQQVNSYGRDIKIHGVNLSVGYPFDPQWFACGESPVCIEVTRLVKSGVVVVVAAGNTGFGYHRDLVKGNITAGLDLTINDPGNAEAAITVGSTHRDMPHRYGVSYFSSKGPTGDGRTKPDLVAPGERILSCAAGKVRNDILAKPDVAGPIDYVEDSGTSMAAAHLSGVIAAFLSIRHEYIGRPEDVKSIFTRTATDLGRTADFQGRGLVDLMRAIQSV